MCGFKVVLTADKTLMCDYGNAIFLGFMTTGPVSGFKPFNIAMRALLKPVPVDSSGKALVAPLALRLIEGALVDSGVVKPDEVAVVPPRALHRAISEETRVIGVSTMDPKGLGPASSTFSGPYGLIHRESYTAFMFRKLIRSEAVQRARRWASLVVGGPGAWQLTMRDLKTLGIDVLFIGEGEDEAPRLFRSLIEEGKPDKPMVVKAPLSRGFARIRGATIGGLVEVSRGCGRACRFCSVTMRILRHKPLDEIIHDVKVNVKAGQTGICLHAEDVLQYGGTPTRKRPDLVIRLFKSVLEVEGANLSSVSHISLSSIAENQKLVSDLSDLLGLTETSWLGYQTGIETASPRLIARLMHMKPYPFKPGEWPSVVEEAFKACSDYNWVPAATLILNLPGEKPEDVLITADLVDDLNPYKSIIVPLLYVPMSSMPDCKPRRLLEDADDAYWQLYHAVWRHDMKWLPTLVREYLAKTKFRVSLAVRLFTLVISNFIDPWVERKLSHITAKTRVETRHGGWIWKLRR